MWGRLFGRGNGTAEPFVDDDPAVDDRPLRTARDLVRAGDWHAARDIVRAAGTDRELRGRRIGVLTTAAKESDGWLMAWLTAEPSSPDAAIIFAALLNDRAGDARGSASAAHTTREQFAAFGELSRAAHEASRRAVALAPDDPQPWIEIIYSQFATGDRNAFDEAVREALRRDPTYIRVHIAGVSFLCQKWFGSHERMFAAARTPAASAPPGSDLHILPVFGHIEYALTEYSFRERTPQSFAACRRYFQRPDVRHEVDACVARFRAGGPHTRLRSLTCLNWIAVAYTLGDRRAEAKAVFDEMLPYYTDAPSWGYFWGDSWVGFRDAWRWAQGHTRHPFTDR
ncbi:hypothetical protein [Virgisporangium aliadipatigenens]|nr:hypothetical protein [Virgisporangium aliadipatigenens]